MVNLLKLGKTISEPIVPPVEWYFERFDLLEKLLAIYLIDVFRIVLLSVKHFVGKNSEHEVFFFGIASNWKGTIKIGLLSEGIEIDTLNGKRSDLNWCANNSIRCLTICKFDVIYVNVIV